MSQRLFARTHLPRPHIADLFSQAFAAAIRPRRDAPPLITPDGHDWPEWHWDRDGGEW